MSIKERALEEGGPHSRNALLLRLVSAAILIPVALAVVALGGRVFAAFAGLVVLLMAWEWVRLSTGGPLRAGDAGLGAGLAAAAVLAACGEAAGALLAGAAGAIVSGLLAARRARRGRADGFWLALGGTYITAALTASVWLRGQPGGYDGFMWLLLLVWSTDTGAYACGRLIGGPAFAPRFSPNKTWAGVAGGVVAAVGAGWLAAEVGFRPAVLGVTGPLWIWAVLFAAAVHSGDILESAAKRHFGIKDSSGLIPGHGGVLDRLDGFLLAVSVAALIALLHAGAGGG